MIKRIIAYIFFGCGLITTIYFGYYTGTTIKDKVIFYFIGLICFLIGWISLRSNARTRDKGGKQIMKMINQLKESGEKIRVELAKCEIKSNDYSEEKDRYPSGILATSYERDVQVWNYILGDEIKNTEMVDIYQSVLIYQSTYMNKDKTFISGIIPIEHTTLLFKLDNQKDTFIYIDKQDPSKYYFDLDFLLT